MKTPVSRRKVASRATWAQTSRGVLFPEAGTGPLLHDERMSLVRGEGNAPVLGGGQGSPLRAPARYDLGGERTRLTRPPRSRTWPGPGDCESTRPEPLTSPTSSSASSVRSAARAGSPASAGTATLLDSRGGPASSMSGGGVASSLMVEGGLAGATCACAASEGGTPNDLRAWSATSRKTGAAISPPYTSPFGSSMKTPIAMRGASAGAKPTKELNRLSTE